MKKYFSIRKIILIILSLTIWVPMLMLIGGSFMGAGEFAENLSPVLSGTDGLAKWPIIQQYPTLRSYIELLLDSPGFFVMFWNSCLLVFPILLGQLLMAVPAAWGFAKYNFRGRKFLFTLYIALMLMPFQVTMVSNYFILDKLELLNTRYAIILPGIFSTFPVFIIYRFFRAIPKTLMEAAAIDGADEFRIFVYIGLPMGSPGIMSAIVLSFLEYWNILEQPLTFLKDKSLWPLSLYLPNIVADKGGLYLAASVVMLLPSLLIFLLGQKYLEKGIRASGLKE